MTLINAQNISKSFGARVCFENISFTVSQGDRIGLIGHNGSGKTTLMRILSGQEEYDGILSIRRDIRISRLEQTPQYPAGSTARSIINKTMQQWIDIETEIDRLHQMLPDMTSEQQKQTLQRLATLEATLDSSGNRDFQRRAETLLHGIGLSPELFDQDVSTLSGGEICRIALTCMLCEHSDLWLFDEPTNHLDLDGIQFLERFLKNSPTAAIVISHDRRFLDHVTNATWEIDQSRLYFYPGNYSTSRKLREEREEQQWRALMQQREFLQREEAFINKWRAGTRSRQAQSRAKRLAKVELLEEPRIQSRLAALNLTTNRRLGDFVLKADKTVIGHENTPLITGLDLELQPGEILGIVGKNGTGKTTLFSTLLGYIQPLSGTFRWGPTVQTGVLAQHEAFPNESVTPFQYLQDANLGASDQDRRDKLGAMLFRGDDVFKPVQVLSGGEKKRLMLTRLLLEGHNVLLLDEPTNHLDIQSTEAVTLALSAYPGTVLVISHDRFFLDEVADRILWLDENSWAMTNGGYTEAEAAHEKRVLELKAKAVPEPFSSPKISAKPSRGGVYKNWSVSKLESKIIANEERIAQIHAEFANPETVRNGNKMRQLQSELVSIENEQRSLEEEYAHRG